jgi:hypothetical protein
VIFKLQICQSELHFEMTHSGKIMRQDNLWGILGRLFSSTYSFLLLTEAYGYCRIICPGGPVNTGQKLGIWVPHSLRTSEWTCLSIKALEICTSSSFWSRKKGTCQNVVSRRGSSLSYLSYDIPNRLSTWYIDILVFRFLSCKMKMLEGLSSHLQSVRTARNLHLSS